MSKSQGASGRPPEVNHCANSNTARGYMYKALAQLSMCPRIYTRPKPPAVTEITDEKRQVGEAHL